MACVEGSAHLTQRDPGRFEKLSAGWRRPGWPAQPTAGTPSACWPAGPRRARDEGAPGRRGRDRRPPARTAPPRLVQSLAPLDEGFEAVIVVGQGLGEGEELGDGVVRAGKAHLDPVVADRDAGGQAGEPAVEGVGGDRDTDPGAAGLAERGHDPVAAGFFVPEGGVLLEPPELAEECGAGEGRIEPVRSAPKARIRVAARARETPKSASRSRRVRRGRSSASSCWMGVGEGEEPPGSGGHLTDRSTRGGRGGWKYYEKACL